MALQLHIPERFKGPLKWVGLPAWAFFVALVSLFVTLPRDRIQERVESLASAALGAGVTSEDFGLTLLFGPGITASGVRIETRPQSPTEKPSVLRLDDVTVRSGLLSLLRGLVDLSFKGHLAHGKVSGRYRSVPDEGVVVVDGSGLSLGAIPQLGAWLHIPGVPIDGTLDLTADVTAPKNLFARSEGSVELTIAGGVIGDGKAKITSAGNPMLASGLTLPRIQLGTLKGEANIDKGNAVLRGVKSHSPDLDVQVQGYVELRDPLAFSVLHLYVLLKPSEALLKRESSLEALVSMGGMMAKRSDGYFGIAITGPFASAQVSASKETPTDLVPGKGGAAAPRPMGRPPLASPPRPPIVTPTGPTNPPVPLPIRPDLPPPPPAEMAAPLPAPPPPSPVPPPAAPLAAPPPPPPAAPPPAVPEPATGAPPPASPPHVGESPAARALNSQIPAVPEQQQPQQQSD